MDDLGGCFRTPENMVWHHPTIRQVHILVELDRDHLRIHLNDNPFQPITDRWLFLSGHKNHPIRYGITRPSNGIRAW
jgi:hypothetical protein